MKITERKPEENGRMYALRILRDNIISNRLQPGTLLSEKEIADKLQISRTPVREAIIELARNGVIEVLPQRGSRVSLIDMERVDESSFFRRTMEVAIAKLACEMATPEDLAMLADQVKLQEFYLENITSDNMILMDDNFHKLLFQICNKMYCYEMVQSMAIYLDRIRSLSVGPSTNSHVVSDHRNIYEAILNRNPEEAERAVMRHLTRYRVDEKGIKEKYPEYFRD